MENIISNTGGARKRGHSETTSTEPKAETTGEKVKRLEATLKTSKARLVELERKILIHRISELQDDMDDDLELELENAMVDNDQQELFLAIMNGEVQEATKLMVQEGANLNLPSGNGMTMLMVAAAKGHTVILVRLLHYGADASAKRAHGTLDQATAFHYVCKNHWDFCLGWCY
jgi:hypothetical protein